MELKILKRYHSFEKEHIQQKELIQMLNQYNIVDNRVDYIFAIPNQSYGKTRADMLRGKKLKAEGRKKGIPDLFLPVQNKDYNGLFIEMKCGYNKPSSDQQYWLKELFRQQFDCIVAYSALDAFEYIVDYLKH